MWVNTFFLTISWRLYAAGNKFVNFFFTSLKGIARQVKYLPKSGK